MQLMVLPIALSAYHHWLYQEEMSKQLCSFTDHVQGECFVVNPGLSAGFFAAAIVMNVLLLINTLIEYFLRAEQVRWVSKEAPARGRHLSLLRVGNSWCYLIVVCSSMMLGVALCLGGSVTVCILCFLNVAFIWPCITWMRFQTVIISWSRCMKVFPPLGQPTCFNFCRACSKARLQRDL